MFPTTLKNKKMLKQIIADGIEAGVDVEDLQKISEKDAPARKTKPTKTRNFKKTKSGGIEKTLYSTGPLKTEHFD